MATREQQLEFLGKFAGPALQAEAKYKIPARLIIGQAALETGWGEHVIGNYGYFGMKYMKRHKRFVEVPTVEYIKGERTVIVDKFADYDSLYDAIADYCWLLSSTDLYKPWYSSYIETGDLNQFVKNLASKYSTANANYYSQTVLNIANSKLVKDSLEGERNKNVSV